MTLRPYIPGSLFLMLAGSALAQNPHLDFRNAVLAYNLTTFKKGNFSHFSSTEFQLLHPTVAFRWRTKGGNFQEVELTRFSLNRTDAEFVSFTTPNSGGKAIVSTDLQFRYEYMLVLNRSKNKRWVPAVGFGAKTGLERTDSKDHSPAFFPLSEQTISLEGQVTPRLTYFFRERLFFDLNIPFSMVYLDHQLSTNRNPAIPQQFQTVNSFNFTTFPVIYSLRFGLGLKV